MKRRKFITLVTAGAGVGTIIASLYFADTDIKRYAGLILKRELAYLNLDKEGCARYLDDYFSSTITNKVASLKWKLLYLTNSNCESSESIQNLVKYYLLSSDFFINKTDERLVVNYLGLFSSYRSPLPNPFSFALYHVDQHKV